MSKRVIVTGGAGYIGSHVCKLLSEQGYEVIVYDNLSTGHKAAVKWGKLVEGDIADEAKLTELLKEFKPDTVMHFAASSLVGESISDPLKYYKNNVAGTSTLLRAMVEAGCLQLVFSSTCAIFGNPETDTITEENEIAPLNPYGESKAIIEQILDSCDKAYGLKSSCLRYFNAAGADASGEIGELHNPETHLIPLVINKALDASRELKIFGDDYPTQDGTCIRDYIHVSDLAEAHLLAMQKLEASDESKKINLGTGSGASVKEVIETVKKLSETNFDIEVAERRAGDPAILVSDNKLAKEYLNWQPKRDLETQIKDALNWHKGDCFGSK